MGPGFTWGQWKRSGKGSSNKCYNIDALLQLKIDSKSSHQARLGSNHNANATAERHGGRPWKTQGEGWVLWKGRWQQLREGRREGKGWLSRRYRKPRALSLREMALCHHPTPIRQKRAGCFCYVAACLEPGARSSPWGRRSVHFQFIYVFYPQSGINDCKTDLIFMSTLRPGLDMRAFPVNCALRAICFSGGETGEEGCPPDHVLMSE